MRFRHERPRPQGKGIGPLTEFARLTGAERSTIFAFVRKWGVLAICQHGLPSGHDCGRRTKESCHPLGHRDGVNFAEPTRAWHFFAKQAASLLKVATLLRQGKTGPAEDMDILVGILSRLTFRDLLTR